MKIGHFNCMARTFFVAIACSNAFLGQAQTFDKWAQSVQWDGVTNWTRYMITRPAFQGPNSLPVPRIGNGEVDSSAMVGATASLHFSKGDNTQNITLYANYCLAKDVIAFDLQWVPYEQFTMNNEIKDQRHVFSEYYFDHHAVGDIYFNTSIQLLNKWRKDIRLKLRFGYRYPAGTGYGTARYTDGPGYHFDLSFGKPFHNSSFKWIGMMGFYCWQVVSANFRQDDAFLFGTGGEWDTRTMRLQTYVAGYLGYMLHGGDKPVVFRTTLEKKLKRNVLLFGFQQGLKDFKYTSIEAGMKYHLF